MWQWFFFLLALPLASRRCDQVVRPDYAIKEWGRRHLPCWDQSSGRTEWDWCDLVESGLYQKKSCLVSLYQPLLAGTSPARFLKFSVISKGPENAWSLHMLPDSHDRGEDRVLWASAASVPVCFLVARARALFHWTVIIINIYKITITHILFIH